MAVTSKWKFHIIQFRDSVNIGNTPNNQLDLSKAENRGLTVEEKGAFLIITGLPGSPSPLRRVRVPLHNVVQINEVEVQEEAPAEKLATKGKEEPPGKPLIGPGGQPLPAARGVTAGTEPAS